MLLTRKKRFAFFSIRVVMKNQKLNVKKKNKVEFVFGSFTYYFSVSGVWDNFNIAMVQSSTAVSMGRSAHHANLAS